MNDALLSRLDELIDQGQRLLQAGELAQAESVFLQVLQLEQRNVDALHLLGVIAHRSGRLDEAVDLISRAIEENPSVASFYLNLGNVFKDQNRLDQAAASYQHALHLNPKYARAYNNLGVILRDQKKLDQAVTYLQNAVWIDPQYVEAHRNLGVTFQTQGKPELAIQHYLRAIQLKPSDPLPYFSLGNVFNSHARRDEAVSCYGQALALKPDSFEVLNALGNTLATQGKLDDASRCFRQAIAVKPDYAEAYSNFANIFLIHGKLDEAIANYRKALALKPDLPEAHSNLIFTLDLTGADTSTLQAERRRWSEAFATGLCSSPAFPQILDPERRLRIGYISADFRTHSAATVFGVMLVKFDPSKFEVFAYSNSAEEDAYTHLFQQSVTCWRRIVDLSDDAVADLVRQDEIDILVDLSGHSSGNRLRVFARRPAPIQITAWGYIGGTGMKAMDVFLADPVVVPPEEKKFYAEEVRYLPNVVGAFFPAPFPPVNALPASSAKGVTFGSFNRLAKVSEEAFKAWAQVLLAIPTSRMVLKIPNQDAGMRDRVIGHFTKTGIDPERIILLERAAWHDHMATFNQIDIALDPFPHGGGVTTLEGLMMGIPVITLRWPTLVGRLSASILTTLGLTDWIAETPEQYVRLAIEKARDLAALAELREKMRSIFTSSVIGNPQAYVQAVEQEYRQLWRKYTQLQT